MKQCLGYLLLSSMMFGMATYYSINTHGPVIFALMDSLARDYTRNFMLSEMAWWRQELCKSSTEQTGRFYELPWLQRNVAPEENDDNIFLVETACKTTPTFRAWCAVESWSKQNPSAKVWYVMTSLAVNGTDGLVSRLQEEYGNLRVVGADVESLFNQTKLKEIFLSKTWIKKSKWPAVHLSDMLRVVLVWTWGGFYTDTDTICIKDVSELRNVISFNNNVMDHVSNGGFHFQRHHRFLDLLMEFQSKNFKAQNWASIGPDAVTSVSKTLCEVSNLKKLKASEVKGGPVKCADFSLLPPKYILPFPWTENKKLFDKGAGDQFNETFNSSYVVHLFGSQTKNQKVFEGDNSIYEVAAKTFCPVTFHHAIATHGVF